MTATEPPASTATLFRVVLTVFRPTTMGRLPLTAAPSPVLPEAARPAMTVKSLPAASACTLPPALIAYPSPPSISTSDWRLNTFTFADRPTALPPLPAIAAVTLITFAPVSALTVTSPFVALMFLSLLPAPMVTRPLVAALITFREPATAVDLSSGAPEALAITEITLSFASALMAMFLPAVSEWSLAMSTLALVWSFTNWMVPPAAVPFLAADRLAETTSRSMAASAPMSMSLPLLSVVSSPVLFSTLLFKSSMSSAPPMVFASSLSAEFTAAAALNDCTFTSLWAFWFTFPASMVTPLPTVVLTTSVALRNVTTRPALFLPSPAVSAPPIRRVLLSPRACRSTPLTSAFFRVVIVALFPTTVLILLFVRTMDTEPDRFSLLPSPSEAFFITEPAMDST